ncbi:MAG: sulfoxide reductase heme-binding subunit YedZ [Gammaproteobacteria bacterium]|nr:sulfoxide reductase heme-binding subunit YedZ [Gammaproteobacteria bacterium]
MRGPPHRGPSDRVLRFALKPIVFIALTIPLAYWGLQVYYSGQGLPNALGADAADRLVEALGSWTLRFLLLALALSTVARRLRLPWIVRFRRMVGVFAMTYALTHFGVYLVFLAGGVEAAIEDIAKRPYITVSFPALLMLIPLGVTSTRGWQRRLGRNWRRLHTLIYPAAILAIVHFIWLSRSDFTEPVIYASILAALLLERLLRRISP